jgi:WD40 repeat protein
VHAASGNLVFTIPVPEGPVGKSRVELDERHGIVRSLTVSPDGKLLAAGFSQGSIAIWNAATGDGLRTLAGHAGENDAGRDVHSLAFSSDGRTLVSGGFDATIRFHDTATGKETRMVRWNDSDATSVRCIQFLPGGAALVASGYDGTIRFFEAATGKQTAQMDAHEGACWGLALSPDGRMMASGGLKDGRLRVWDVASRTRLAEMEGQPNGIMDVAFSPDGLAVASSGYMYEVAVRDLGGWRLDLRGDRLETLAKQLGDRDWARRQAAYQALKDAGRQAIPVLRQAAKSFDAEVAHSAAELLGLLGEPVP